MPKKTATLSETPVGEVQQDRRAKRRYLIELPVEYRNGSGTNGLGTSLDLSGKGIAFRTTAPPKVGSYIELSVSWPVLLNETCPLQLVVSGKVLRSDSRCTAMRLDRYEFRTQSAKAAANAGG